MPSSARIEDVAQAAVADGKITEAEVSRAIREIGYLSTFFGRLATNEAIAVDGARWEELRNGYATAAGQLMRLRATGAITTADLPTGMRSEVRGKEIVLDRTLDGEWLPESVSATRRSGRDDWIYTSLLSNRLLEALAKLEGYRGWPWFDAQLAQSGLGERLVSASLEGVGPLLVRYWYLQDRFLWASIAVKAADEERVREAWGDRSALLAVQMDVLLGEVGEQLDEAWKAGLARRWNAYQRSAAEIGDAFSGGPLLSARAATPDVEPGTGTEAEPASNAEAGGAKPEDFAAVEKRIAELENQLNQLTTELQASRRETKELEDALEAAGGEVTARVAVEGEPAKSSRDQEERRDRDRQKVTDLEQQLRELQTDVTLRREQADRLQKALTSVRQEAGSIDPEQQSSRDLLQAQARQITAERKRVAELEQRLADLGSELSASRGEAARYKEEIDSNQGKIARYQEQIKSTTDELARYRVQLDAAMDRDGKEVPGFVERVTKDQTAIVVLAGLLLLISVLSITMLARRSPAAVGNGSGAAPNGSMAAGADHAQFGTSGRDARPAQADASAPAEVGLEERRARSEAIARDESASHQDVRALAYDDIEVALPVLVKSEALSDDDLIDVIHKTTNQHRLAIAIRKAVSARVAERLVETGDAKVIAALLENPEAEIPSAVLKELARRANQVSLPKASQRKLSGISIEDVQGLRRPLSLADQETANDPARRERETPAQNSRPAIANHDVKPDAAKATGPISETRQVPPGTTEKTLPSASSRPVSARPAPNAPPYAAADEKATDDIEAAAREDGSLTAVETGDVARPATGAVAPHALIEALRQGKMELFEALFGKLTGLRQPRVQEVLYGSGGEELAIACRALDLNKPLMTSIFIWSRKGRPEFGHVNPRELSHAMTIFDGISPDQARDAVETWHTAANPTARWYGTRHGPAAE